MLPGIADWLDVDTALDAIRILIELVKLLYPRARKAPAGKARPKGKRKAKRNPRRR